jgi:hypothetical protein
VLLLVLADEHLALCYVAARMTSLDSPLNSEVVGGSQRGDKVVGGSRRGTRSEVVKEGQGGGR